MPAAESSMAKEMAYAFVVLLAIWAMYIGVNMLATAAGETDNPKFADIVRANPYGRVFMDLGQILDMWMRLIVCIPFDVLCHDPLANMTIAEKFEYVTSWRSGRRIKGWIREAFDPEELIGVGPVCTLVEPGMELCIRATPIAPPE